MYFFTTLSGIWSSPSWSRGVSVFLLLALEATAVEGLPSSPVVFSVVDSLNNLDFPLGADLTLTLMGVDEDVAGNCFDFSKSSISWRMALLARFTS